MTVGLRGNEGEYHSGGAEKWRSGEEEEWRGSERREQERRGGHSIMRRLESLL